MSAPALFDWEVECTKNTGRTVVIEIGYAASAEAAAARVMENYGKPESYRDWHAVSAKALRTTRAHCPDDTQIAQLRVVSDSAAPGVYLLADDQGRHAYGEHGGGHIRRAFEFLQSSKPDAKWKTLEMLKTLRQAFREDSVNCHDDYIAVLMQAGPSRSAVTGYLSGARCRDRAHHGSHTF